MSLKLIRKISLLLLPLLLVSAVLSHFLLFSARWSEIFYIIALTANIGYFTNYVAIKMLFRPYQPSVFGRQGLIPKNQPKLAKALSATLNHHFLANEHWHEYLTEANLVQRVVAKSQLYCQAWLNDSDNNQQLVEALVRHLKDNELQLAELLEPFQKQVLAQVSSELNINTVLEQSFEWVEKQFAERPHEMAFLIEPIVTAIAENVPSIAAKLVQGVDEHIENQDTIKRNIAKAVRWSANISEDDIRQYLFRMVASPEFRKTLFEGLESIVSDYKKRTTQPDRTQQSINLNTIVSDFIHLQAKSINLTQLIIQSLEKPENQQNISIFINQSIKPLFEWLEQLANQPQVNQMIIQQIIQLIEAIDLGEIIEQKAARFSPRQMEDIFQTMISDQLIFIELLGALLGGLSGLALVDLTVFGGLSGCLISGYLIDRYLTNQRDQKATKLALDDKDKLTTTQFSKEPSID